MLATNGNWIDLIVVAIFLIYLGNGLRDGFLQGTINLLGFLFSFVLAIKFYPLMANLLTADFSLSLHLANAVGFILLAVLAEIIYSVAISLVFFRFPRRVPRFVAWVNTVLGIFPAAGEALILTAFFLTLLIALPVRGDIKKDILSSQTGGPIVERTQLVEEKLNNVFGPAIADTLNFITVNPDLEANQTIQLGFTQPNTKIDSTSEAVMLNLVNTERERAGLPPLSSSGPLKTLAESYGRELFARGYFSHYTPEGLSPFDRMRAAGITFTAAGENLALAPNVRIAHEGLMNSPGHRANILSPNYHKIGIGAIDGGVYGEIFVQEFTD